MMLVCLSRIGDCLGLCLFYCGKRVFISSAYANRSTFGGGVGMSEVYKLKSAGGRQLPCGTPHLMVLYLDCCLWYLVYAFLLLM